MCRESFDFLSLPSVFHATRLMNETSGQFFIEAFAGSAVFTLAVLMNGILCLCPWEIELDSRLDIVRNLHQLLFAIEIGLIAAMHLGGLPPRLQELVDQGNLLALVSCQLCVALYEQEAYFSLENPEHSLLWLLPQVLEVFDMPGVASVLLTYAAYGTLYLKPTILIHNLPTLQALALPLPFNAGPMIELRGWVRFE